MVCQIAEMTAQDYGEVAELWRNTEGIGLDDNTDTREGIAAYLARNPGLSYVARQDERIVGAVLCGHDGRRGYLHHLAVAVADRHQGIGRALVEACLTKLDSIGIQKCNIFLFSDNEAGEEFWNHIGWKGRADLKVLQKATPGGSFPRIVIRPATIEDAEAISTLIVPLVEKFLVQALSPRGRQNLLSSTEPASIRGFFEARYRYHVAEVEGLFVGVVGMREDSHIHHLFVAEDFQRRGIARQLWTVAKEACLAGGNTGRFTVYSSRYALEAYRKFGFIEAGPPETNDEVIAVPMKYEP